jgi:hypothetical protein
MPHLLEFIAAMMGGEGQVIIVYHIQAVPQVSSNDSPHGHLCYQAFVSILKIFGGCLPATQIFNNKVFYHGANQV